MRKLAVSHSEKESQAQTQVVVKLNLYCVNTSYLFGKVLTHKLLIYFLNLQNYCITFPICCN